MTTSTVIRTENRYWREIHTEHVGLYSHWHHPMLVTITYSLPALACLSVHGRGQAVESAVSLSVCWYN